MPTGVLQIKVGPMMNFVYLVYDESTKKAALIDSGWEIEPIVKNARNLTLDVLFVIATHEHFDHVSSLEEAASAFRAKTVSHKSSGLKTDIYVDEGQELKIGESRLLIMHTPGHTPASICIYDGKNLFTGDTLFIENCGRTDLPGGSDEQLFKSLSRIAKLPDETIIYPGHDYGSVPFRRLGDEKIYNPALRASSLKEFRAVP